MYKDYLFDFEKLDVYKKSLAFSKEIFLQTLNFRKEIQYSLGDQFRRASLSICNNIAEGSRKYGKSKKQFYEYAFDSTRECVPMISLSSELNQITKAQEDELRSQCIQICNKLYRLTESVRV